MTCQIFQMTFIFDRCRRSLAVVQFVYDIQKANNVFIIEKVGEDHGTEAFYLRHCTYTLTKEGIVLFSLNISLRSAWWYEDIYSSGPFY